MNRIYINDWPIPLEKACREKMTGKIWSADPNMKTFFYADIQGIEEFASHKDPSFKIKMEDGNEVIIHYSFKLFDYNGFYLEPRKVVRHMELTCYSHAIIKPVKVVSVERVNVVNSYIVRCDTPVILNGVVVKCGM